MLSKQEMEDIWHNKPIGYLKSQISKLKKLKTYSCSVMPYKQVYGETAVFTVKAETVYTAELKAIELYKAKYPSSEWKDYNTNARLV